MTNQKMTEDELKELEGKLRSLSDKWLNTKVLIAETLFRRNFEWYERHSLRLIELCVKLSKYGSEIDTVRNKLYFEYKNRDA